jgi:hypothetical protein
VLRNIFHISVQQLRLQDRSKVAERVEQLMNKSRSSLHMACCQLCTSLESRPPSTPGQPEQLLIDSCCSFRVNINRNHSFSHFLWGKIDVASKIDEDARSRYREAFSELGPHIVTTRSNADLRMQVATDLPFVCVSLPHHTSGVLAKQRKLALPSMPCYSPGPLSRMAETVAS